MGLLQTVVMAAVNAVTAFLPIGSSGHRHVVPAILGWASMDPAAMVAVYVGMLGAVASYFWRDVITFAMGAGKLIRGRMDASARLLLFVLGATAPAAIAGLLMRHLGWTSALGPTTIGWTSLVFGLLLLAGDRIGVTVRKLSHATWSSAMIIGLTQVLAVIPGVGRSGIDVTLARVLGFERTEAARFSLLLSLPLLVGAIALTTLDAASIGALTLTLDAAIAGLTAFVAGLAAIAAMMAWLEERTFIPFALYRIVAGAALLGWIYLG